MSFSRTGIVHDCGLTGSQFLYEAFRVGPFGKKETWVKERGLMMLLQCVCVCFEMLMSVSDASVCS